MKYTEYYIQNHFIFSSLIWSLKGIRLNVLDCSIAAFFIGEMILVAA